MLPDGGVPLPPTAVVRVLVVDRERVFAELVGERLDREDDLTVVAALHRTAPALALARADRVDVLVLGTATEDAPQLTSTLRQVCAAGPRPVVLADREPPAAVLAVLQAGARAWVPKSASVDVLLLALRHVAQGEVWLPGAVLGPVLQQALRASQPASGPLDVLSPREREVLAAMSAGSGQTEIAAQLFLSINTVRTHRRRLLQKLGVNTSLAAVALARSADAADR